MTLAHSLRLTRIDVRRMVRKRTAPDSWLTAVVSVGLYALLTLVLTGGGVWGGRTLGRALATGSIGVDSATAASGARGFVGVLWLALVFICAVRAIGQRGTLTNADGVLTVVPVHEAYLGLVASEFVYLLVWALLPAAGAGLGLAVGSGTVWPAVGVPLALATMCASAVTTAYALGLAVRHAATRFPFVARNKTALLAVGFVVYMAAIVTGSFGRVFGLLFEPLAASPVGWFADLAVAGVPGVASAATRGVAAVGVAVALTAIALLAGTWVAGRHWFADPVLAGEDSDSAEPATAATANAPAATRPSTEDRLMTVLELGFDRPTAALVAVAWRRAARSPLKLMYAGYPLFFGTGAFVDIVQTGQIPTYLPYGLLVFFAWAGGVAFTLNPLGDQGAVLSTTLLSEVGGRRFVAAHVAAGLLAVVPLGTALVALTAVASPLDAESVTILVGLTPIATVVAAALSVGIGVAFPRFEATNVTRSMEAVVPSPWAFLLFSLHVVATTVAALFVGLDGVRAFAAQLFTAVAPFGLSVSAGGLDTASTVVLVALLLLPALSYRYAVRAFDRYTIA